MNRLDFSYIFNSIPENSRVLDLGCGKGELLYLLKSKCNFVQGIEKKEEDVYECLKNQIPIYHGDIKEGLSYHKDHSFDYVILNQTIQETTQLEFIISEALRVSKFLIIAFPNFAHFEIRFSLLFKGRAPMNSLLKDKWYNTPNIRFLSILDFIDFCYIKKYKILQKTFFNDNKMIKFFSNIRSKFALFIIQK